MTLYTTDYLEYYLTLIGWVISNGVWNVLVASGVFAIPFIAIIIQEWLKARSEGADEGNKGALSAVRIENRVWVAIIVILFAGIPLITVDVSTIKFDETRSRQCQVNVPLPDDTQWGTAFTSINNQSAKVPVWWFFMHALSRGITGAAVASIPCGHDLRQMRMDIDSTRIGDPVLAQEVADFTHDCYGPSRAKLFMSRPELNEAAMNDVSWIGSRYFLNTAGFYDNYHAATARSDWPYSSTRDAGLAEVADGGGYPDCKAWWSDAGKGLRGKLLKQVKPDLLTQFAKWTSEWMHSMSQEDINDSVIRAIASPRQQTMNQGDVYTDYGGQIGKTIPNYAARTASDLGLTVGAMGYFPAMDVMRQALPLVLSFLKMALIICIPMLLVIGTYELKAVVTISCVEFALLFVDFWFQLARWIDSTILNALYGWDSPHSNFNPLLGLNNAFGDMLLNFVMAMMFIVLPIFWVTSLTWVGVRTGAILQGLTAGTAGAIAAGRQGTGVIQKMAK